MTVQTILCVRGVVTVMVVWPEFGRNEMWTPMEGSVGRSVGVRMSVLVLPFAKMLNGNDSTFLALKRNKNNYFRTK